MRLTKSTVDKLPIPPFKAQGQTNQKRYYDDTLKGFGLRITSGGTKAFFVEKGIQGKLRRITLGHYPALTVEMARKEAQKVLGKIATGIDPISEKEESRVKAISLNEVFEEYKTTRKSLKKKTLYDYARVMNVAFGDWQTKSLLTIDREEVEKRHKGLAEKHGEDYANLAMRVLRALFNFSIVKYRDAQKKPLISENPVHILTLTHAWFPSQPRKTYIKRHQLEAWFPSILGLENSIIRDYLLLILFTGLRRNEAAQLTWDQIDLIEKILTIPDPKNRHPHVLPLSDFLYTLLLNRKQMSNSPYVFPGEGQGGFLTEPRKQMDKVIQETNIKFTVHDLRRTFITIAESLEISAYALKRLLNHKSKGDITMDYIIIDVERLRKPMQMISDYLCQSMPQKVAEYA